MKILIGFMLAIASLTAGTVQAAGLIRIADGDCAALSSASASPAALLQLARNGTYAACQMQVSGDITIEGNGARLAVPPTVFTNVSQVTIASGARLTLRNLELTDGSATTAKGTDTKAATTAGPYPGPAAIANQGTLLLDSVAMPPPHESFGYVFRGGSSNHLFDNTGKLTLRNVTLKDVFDLSTGASGDTSFSGLLSGVVEISHSTIVLGSGGSGVWLMGAGQISVANSVIADGSGPICNPAVSHAGFVSLGGNVVTDATCGFHAANDKVVSDPKLLDYARHGGVVPTLALDYASPAIGNGVVANCEAADARGTARGASACDAGAYEVGGGNGKLSATGMSGLYFNSANNGHYVSIQKLYGDQALVIWNTFDEHGVPAWLYGVGTISGSRIHVAQVAQNVGGTLHEGGNVTGATPTLWGTFDVDLADCYNATLSYSSPQPQFGSGSTTLQRLAFLDGVNCAR